MMAITGIKGPYLDIGGAEYTTRGAGIEPDSDGTAGSGADHTSTLNAFFAARSSGDVVRISRGPGGAGYRITDTVTVPVGVHVIQDAPLYFDNSTAVAALVIGDALTDNAYVRLHGLQVYRVAQSDWSSESSVGIRLYNCVACDIDIRQVQRFAINVQAVGDGSGFVYNTVRLGRLRAALIGLDLDAINTGWVNENVWIGGTFARSAGVNQGLSRYGVRITSSDASYLNNNNNTFYKPSFELGQVDAETGNPAGEALPVLIEHGQNNAFHDCRNEGNASSFARVENASHGNEFSTGYGTCTVDDAGTLPTSSARSRATLLFDRGRTVLHSGPVHRTACYADGATSVHVPRVHVEQSAGAQNYADSGITLGADYLELATTRGLGVYVDCRRSKRFVVRKDVEDGFGGRVLVRAYDATGAVISTGTPVLGSSGNTFSFNAGFGGAWRLGSDRTSDTYFEVSDDVEYVAVILAGVSAALRIRSFSVVSVDGSDAHSYTSYIAQVADANLGSAAPTAGTWGVGRRVYNVAPAASGTEGWVCVTAGTPGTWKTFGAIAA